MTIRDLIINRIHDFRMSDPRAAETNLEFNGITIHIKGDSWMDLPDDQLVVFFEQVCEAVYWS